MTPAASGALPRSVHPSTTAEQALECLDPELRDARYTMFLPCVVDLVGVLLVLMRYPDEIEQLSEAEVGLVRR